MSQNLFKKSLFEQISVCCWPRIVVKIDPKRSFFTFGPPLPARNTSKVASGLLLGCSWAAPGCSWAAPGCSWAAPGCSRAAPGLLLAAPGCSCAAPALPLRCSCAAPGLLLGCSWPAPGCSWPAPGLLPVPPLLLGCSFTIRPGPLSAATLVLWPIVLQD